ncbi:Histidine--tRNA ligase [compost metagenome]
MIGLANGIMKAFGATEDMFTIKINNRKLINFMMAQFLGLDGPEALSMVKLFDRKDKISGDEFTAQAANIFGEEMAESGLAKITQLLAAKSMADLPSELRESSAVREVQELFTLLEAAGVTNAIFDITLMRGLDYYTGTVFEVVDTDPQNNRSLFGGGRYDGLVGLFGAEPIPTVGMAPGLTTTELFLQTHGLLPQLASTTDIGIIVLGDSLKGALRLAEQLRGRGVNIEVDISGRKLEKQMKAVLKKNVPFMLFVGEQELADGLYSLKDVTTEQEQKLTVEAIAERISQRYI